MKKLLIIALLLISISIIAQEKHTSVMLGYKSIEVSASYTVESELVFGLALSATQSGIVEKRANNNDLNRHEFKNDVIPAAFFLIGGKFDKFTMIGKLGGAYLEQKINNKPDSQKFYYGVGVIFDYQFENGYSIRSSYDNVSGPLVGVGFNF